MLRRILTRKWQRCVYVFVLLTCLCMAYTYVWDVLPKGGRDVSRTKKLKFDHWGQDDIDYSWMVNLLSLRSGEIPVVVVEEHYEVLKYWFQAAELGVIPMSKNILIHVDGHVDGSLPFSTEDLPVFRFPRSRHEVYRMMQRNDMFIVIAALTGLIDHVVWVWPDWDIDDHEESHITIDVEMGYTRVKELGQGSHHRLDLCSCWRVQAPDQTHEKLKLAESWECHRKNFTETEAENGPAIERSECEVQSRGVFEAMSENVAADKIRTISHPGQVILDIDEDFYGCWSDMINMEEVGIKRQDIFLVSDILGDLFTGLTASEEQLVDECFHSLVKLVIHLKSKSCEVIGLHHSERCLRNVEVSNFLIENIPFVLDFLHLKEGGENILGLTDPRQAGVYLQSLLLFLQNLSIQQLKLLAELGACFNLSPSSYYFHNEGRFHVCHGDNMTNSTLVAFHLPTREEIAKRTQSLHKILISLFQKPSLVTVSRSVRDGYTPKIFFSVIEKDVLQALTWSFRGVEQDNIHFDTSLLGLKFGWPGRSHSWYHELLKFLSLPDVAV